MPVPRDVRSHPAPPSVRQTSAANPRTRVPSPAHRSHPVAARFAPSADRHSAEHRPRQPSESTAPAPSSPQSEKRKDQPDCRASRRSQPGAAPIDSNANPTPSSSMHPLRCELHTHQDYAKPATKSKNGSWTAETLSPLLSPVRSALSCHRPSPERNFPTQDEARRRPASKPSQRRPPVAPLTSAHTWPGRTPNPNSIHRSHRSQPSGASVAPHPHAQPPAKSSLARSARLYAGQDNGTRSPGQLPRSQV